MNVLPRLVWLFCFLLIWFPASALAADRFAMFASEERVSEGLADALGVKDGVDVQLARSIGEALRAKADVVVLFQVQSNKAPLSPEEIELLKTKKVIGIGFGAAQLFELIGLEVNAGGCAHGVLFKAPRMVVPKSSLLPDRTGDDVLAFEPSVEPATLKTPFESPFGLHLPSFDEKTQDVEAITRWKHDMAYAVVARQGNHVLVCLNTPVGTWSPELRTLLRDTATSLAKAPNVPFALPRRALTPPGGYEFELLPQRNYTEPHSKNFFFQFPKPGRFVAVLEHQGSEAMMLFFANRKGIRMSRKDARKDKGTSGETLRIELDLTQADIDLAGENYWKLEVVNFDRTKEASWKLRIEYPAE